MQLSGRQWGKVSVPSFANHTPRDWDMTAPAGAPSSLYPRPGHHNGQGAYYWTNSSRRPAVQSLSTGHSAPLYGASGKVDASPAFNMGQQSSSPAPRDERLNSTLPTTIWREDSIRQVEEVCHPRHHPDHNQKQPIAAVASSTPSLQALPPLSTRDSWSMHYDCTDQAPYSNPTNAPRNETMITQTSLLHLRRDNASYDLAHFLRTSGPVAPHRKPSRVESHPPPAVNTLKNPLRFLKLRRGGQQQRRAHAKLDGALKPEIENYQPAELIPRGVEQKISSNGTRYLALPSPPSIEQEPCRHSRRLNAPSILSPDILESRVSVLFQDESVTGDVLDTWISELSKQQSETDDRSMDADSRPTTASETIASKVARRCPTPIRPAASNPPTPVPESIASTSESFHDNLSESPAARASVDTARALSRQEKVQTSEISRSITDSPIEHPYAEEEVEIRHPLPRRLGSHPVLLQRASSGASTLDPPPTLIETPDPPPPPPRSPLRLRRDPRTIDSVVERRSVIPKIAPNIVSSSAASEFDFGLEPQAMTATVTTECTGPIKRPKSRNNNNRKKKKSSIVTTNSGSLQRDDREENLRARREQRPNRTIDSIVRTQAMAASTSLSTRQKLRKLRPSISIPTREEERFRPVTLHTPSSDGASWRKITQSTTPISPSGATTDFEDDEALSTPISPGAICVASEVPLPKTRVAAAKILKESKSKPRPRSASMKRKKRASLASRPSSISPSRSKSPPPMRDEEVPPLPPFFAPPASSPPNRTLPLPPLLPAEDKTRSSKANTKSKLASHPTTAVASSSSHHSPPPASPLPHISTQQLRAPPFSAASSARISARLEALERQNQLLSTALMAVLQSNGGGTALSLHSAADSERCPMKWEQRVLRRQEGLGSSREC